MGNSTDITVLVIDDDTSVRLGISILLQKCGFKALVAESGVEGVKIWAEQGPDIDVLLVDIVMPTATGPEVVRELIKVGPPVPVIFMTGIGHAQACDATKDIPVSVILEKPFSVQSLVKAITGAVGRQTSRSAAVLAKN